MCASCLLVHCIHTSMLFYSLLSPLMPWIHPTMHPHNEQLVKILCCCHFFVNNCLFVFFLLFNHSGRWHLYRLRHFFFVSAFVLIMSPFMFFYGIFFSLSLSQKKYQNVNFFITKEQAWNINIPVRKFKCCKFYGTNLKKTHYSMLHIYIWLSHLIQ